MTVTSCRAALPTVAPPHRRSAGIARTAAALSAGGLFYLSFPPRSLWILAPIGFAVLTLVLRGRGIRAGFGYGFVAGVGLFLPLLPWVGTYVGPVPWLALAAAQALAVGLFGSLAVPAMRL